LEQVARKGSWFGGGSAAALGAALSAALLEKLTTTTAGVRALRVIRRDCVRLIEQDAVRFAKVIEATRAGNRAMFRRSLKTATDVPCRVCEHAQAIQAACRRAQRSVKVQFQSDLRCARALAQAAETSARALIDTNLTWLNDPAYTKTIHHRIQST